jgi:hypothetical protein
MRPLPDGKALRTLLIHHVWICLSSFLVFELGRVLTMAVVHDPDVVFLPLGFLSVAADFAGTVLLLSFFRCLYAFPLLFVRPSLARAGNWLLFCLVFAFVLHQRESQAIGASVSATELTVYHPFHRTGDTFPLTQLSPVQIRQTALVSCLEFPKDGKEADIRFVPVFQFDGAGLRTLEILRQKIQAAQESRPGA